MERDQKMRFLDASIFKGLTPLKMPVRTETALVPVLSGRKRVIPRQSVSLNRSS
jgi:hypothetical protein